MRRPPAIGVRQWNCDHESASLVEWWLGKNKPRTMLCLLVADSWIHTCPNNVPAGRKGGSLIPLKPDNRFLGIRGEGSVCFVQRIEVLLIRSFCLQSCPELCFTPLLEKF